MGHDTIKLGRTAYQFNTDVEAIKVTYQENEITSFRSLILVILAITLIGLLLAIPLYFAWKKKRMVIAIKTKDGVTFSVESTTNKETQILKKYSGIGAFNV